MARTIPSQKIYELIQADLREGSPKFKAAGQELPMKVVFTLVVALLASLTSAYAQIVEVPPKAAPVVDPSGALSDIKPALEQKLAQLRDESGAEVSVLVMPSIGSEAIEQFSIRVVDQWKLGRAGIDDGALLIVALQERQLRIEVGRGLEGDIPDAIAKRIIAEQITPYFKQGQISAGVSAGVDALASLIRKTGLPAPNDFSRNQPPEDSAGVLLLIVVLFVIGSLLASILGSLIGATSAGGLGIIAGAFITSPLLALGLGALLWFLVIFREPILQALMNARVSSGGGGSSGSRSWGSGGGFSGGGASGRW